MYRSGVRKAKAHLELSLMCSVNGNEKTFCKCINSRCIMTENMGLLLTGAGDLMAKDMGKTKIQMLPLPVFTDKVCLQKSQASKTGRRIWSNGGLLSMEDYHFREY